MLLFLSKLEACKNVLSEVSWKNLVTSSNTVRWLSRMRVRPEVRESRVWSLPGPATFFRGDWSWNIFYGHSLLSADSRRQLSVSGKRICTSIGLSLSRKKCGKLTAFNMTPVGWQGQKTSTQTKKKLFGLNVLNYQNILIAHIVWWKFYVLLSSR